MNLERVEEVLRSVNALIRGGMDWGDLEKLIEGEKGRGNVVARMIEGVRVGEGKVVVGLKEEQEEEEGSGEEEGDQTDEEGEGEDERRNEKREGRIVKIELDLGLSAYANAREYFDRKKVAAEKVYIPLPLPFLSPAPLPPFSSFLFTLRLTSSFSLLFPSIAFCAFS